MCVTRRAKKKKRYTCYTSVKSHQHKKKTFFLYNKHEQAFAQDLQGKRTSDWLRGSKWDHDKKRKKNENTDRREVQKNKRGPARFPKKRERLMAPHRRMRCGHLGRGDRIKRGGLNLQHRTSKAASFRKRAREETFIKSEHRTLRTRRHLHTAAPPNLV